MAKGNIMPYEATVTPITYSGPDGKTYTNFFLGPHKKDFLTGNHYKTVGIVQETYGDGSSATKLIVIGEGGKLLTSNIENFRVVN